LEAIFLAEGMSLEELRNEVTRITLDIFRLCGERLLLVKKIGEIKARENIPIEDPDVEEELKSRVLRLCRRYGMNVDFCLKVLYLLLDESKKVQREVIKP
jgi:chorismate mutase